MGKFDEDVGAQILPSQGVIAKLIQKELRRKFAAAAQAQVTSVDTQKGTYEFTTVKYDGAAATTTRWTSTYRLVVGGVEIDDDFPEEVSK